ncbi:hypothetical protein [Oscillatoria nigro-viridis]|uniref:hypothetical protein n=1 Tax=Phormidium nigroviride TaxID=482564 RepID=UPI0002F5B3DD|nr:hypothetical protein [Oscillatoria nigro-viridis]
MTNKISLSIVIDKGSIQAGFTIAAGLTIALNHLFFATVAFFIVLRQCDRYLCDAFKTRIGNPR